MCDKILDKIASTFPRDIYPTPPNNIPMDNSPSTLVYYIVISNVMSQIMTDFGSVINIQCM